MISSNYHSLFRRTKAGELLNLMKEVKEEKSHSKNLSEKLQAAITYYGYWYRVIKARKSYGVRV